MSTIAGCTTATPVPLRDGSLEARSSRLGLDADQTLASPITEAAEFRRAGDPHSAKAVLSDWLVLAPRDASSGLGCVLLGLVHFELTEYGQTERVLSTCEAPETLSDMVHWMRGESLRGLGRPMEARRHFDAITAQRHSPMAPAAGFRVADALFEADAYQKALASYEAMLDTYPEYPEAPTVRYRMAVCRAELGSPELAVREFDRIARYVPTHDAGIAARRALGVLTHTGVKAPARTFESQLAWAVALRRERRWPEAYDVLIVMDDLVSGKRERGRLAEERARVLESLDRYDEALTQVGISRKNGGWVSDLRSMRIRLLRKLGRTEEAVKLATRRMGKKARALRSAEMYYEDGHYEKAQALYARHLKTGRDPARMWLQAWIDYRAGKHARARRGFARLVNHPKIRRHKARYWLARAQQEGGLTKFAIRTFRQVAEADPNGYYGLQAANRLLDLGETELYRRLTGVDEDHVTAQAVRDTLGGQVRWAGADGSELPAGPPRERRTDAIHAMAERYGAVLPELWRAYDRYRIGLDDDARRSLRIARSEYDRARSGSPRRLADRPTSLHIDNRARRRGLWGSSLRRTLGLSKAQKAEEEARLRAIRSLDGSVRRELTELLADIGDPYYGRRLAYASHGRVLKGGPTEASSDVFKAAYPLVFESVLMEETGRYGVPPYLMTAVARVESAFNELAVSTAGARGLLQVMPVTGRLIAQRRGDWEFSPSELLDPEVSLSYGTWYMNQLLEKFRGQEPLAIIGYNAGPHRVQQWLARRGARSDLDEFIEEVPYTQARRYVKSVLRYIALYRRIYSGRHDTYVGQHLDPNFGDNINW